MCDRALLKAKLEVLIGTKLADQDGLELRYKPLIAFIVNDINSKYTRCLFSDKTNNMFMSEGTGVFKEDRIRVTQDKKDGYLNELCELVIPLEYEHGSEFCNNRAIVAKENKLGVIDKHNNIIIPIIYWRIRLIDNKVFELTNDKLKAGIADHSGKIVVPVRYYFVNLNNGRYIALTSKEKHEYDYSGKLVKSSKRE